MRASMTAPTVVDAHRIVDTSPARSDLSEPLCQRLLKKRRQCSNRGTKSVVAIQRTGQSAGKDVLRQARSFKTTQETRTTQSKMAKRVEQPENQSRLRRGGLNRLSKRL